MRTPTSALVKTAWILAIYCVAVMVLLAWKPRFTNASVPVKGVTDPGLAMQMSRTAADVDNVLGDAPSADREVMRIKQFVDFAFIPGYVALALVIGEQLARRGRLIVVIRLAQALAVVAGVADVRENVLILRIVDLRLSETAPALLGQLHFASSTKWALLSSAMALVSAIVLTTGHNPSRFVGLLGLAGAGLTVFGLLENSILMWGALLTIFTLLLMAATLKLLTHESVTKNSIERSVRRSV